MKIAFVIRYVTYTVCFLLGLTSLIAAAKHPAQGIPESMVLKKIPKRPRDAVTGSQFALETAGMNGKERQARAVDELLRGNVPDFMRKLKPVHLPYLTPQGKTIKVLVWVTPDYVAVGSDEDFLRIPLTFPSAVKVAKAFDCILPTPKMVDAIHEQSTCHLEPEPLPSGPTMRSVEYYLRHRAMIRTQRLQAGCTLGELVAGHKKDVVITNRLNRKPGRIAIYGWHERNGEPIQPLSIFHGKNYADYSHGLRLICNTAWVNGKPRSLLKLLQDPRLGPAFTDEGFIAKLPKMLNLR